MSPGAELLHRANCRGCGRQARTGPARLLSCLPSGISNWRVPQEGSSSTESASSSGKWFHRKILLQQHFAQMLESKPYAPGIKRGCCSSRRHGHLVEQWDAGIPGGTPAGVTEQAGLAGERKHRVKSSKKSSMCPTALDSGPTRCACRVSPAAEGSCRPPDQAGDGDSAKPGRAGMMQDF